MDQIVSQPMQTGARPQQTVAAGEARKSGATTRKVAAAAGGSLVSGAIATLVLYYFDPQNALSPELKMAITTLVAAVCAWASGWFVAPAADEAIVMTEDGPRSATRAPA